MNVLNSVDCSSHKQTGTTRKISRKSFLALLSLLVLAGSLIYLPYLGSYPLVEPSDGVYTEGSREMLETGDYIVPHVNYVPYHEKPILIYWLGAAGQKLVGVSEFGGRLPSAISAVASSVLTFVFGSMFVGTGAALLSAAIVCSSALLVVVAHMNLCDAPLTLFTQVAALSFLAAIETDRKNLCWLGYVALALGILVKGPVILVLVGLMGIIYLLSTRKFSDAVAAVASLKPLPGIALTLALSVPWYVAVGILTHGQFLSEFFIKHNFMRVLGKIKFVHPEPFWFFAPVLIAGMQPWAWLPAIGGKRLGELLKTRYELSVEDKLVFFSWIWTATVFIFFSSSVSKLATYVLPVIPALGLISGITLFRLLERNQKKPLLIGLLCSALFTVGLFIGAWIYLRPTGYVAFGLIAALVAFLVAPAMFAVLFNAGDKKKAAACLVALNIIGSAFFGPALFEGVFFRRQIDYQRLLEVTNHYPGSLAQVIDSRCSINFYLRSKAPAPCLNDMPDVAQFVHLTPAPHMVVVHDKMVPWIASFPFHQELERRGPWHLYRIEDANDKLLKAFKKFFTPAQLAQIASTRNNCAADCGPSK